MIPAHQFAPLTGLDSYFTHPLPVAGQEPTAVEPPPRLPVTAPPVTTLVEHAPVDAPRARIPAPTMRWAARPAQAIGMLSDNPCAACPHA